MKEAKRRRIKASMHKGGNRRGKQRKRTKRKGQEENKWRRAKEMKAHF